MMLNHKRQTFLGMAHDHVFYDKEILKIAATC